MNIGSKIRKRRIELGISQEQLATLVGYTSRSTINKIESGTRDFPRKQAMAFSKVLQVPVEYLLVEMDDAEDEAFVESLGTIKPLDELDDELKAMNTLLKSIGEQIISVYGKIYLGECGQLSEEEIDFIKTSARTALKVSYDLIKNKRIKSLEN